MKKILPKIAILFSGVGSNMAYILEHMHNRELEVVMALTNNPDAGGIGIAKSFDIPLEIVDSSSFASRESFDEAVVARLQKYKPDLVVLAGFMRILTPVFTDQIKAVNLHPSLLPRHKGLKAIERSYADSFPNGGVTIHWVSSDLDGGEIILQREIDKAGLSISEYDKKIRIVEKAALADGIRSALGLL